MVNGLNHSLVWLLCGAQLNDPSLNTVSVQEFSLNNKDIFISKYAGMIYVGKCVGLVFILLPKAQFGEYSKGLNMPKGLVDGH